MGVACTEILPHDSKLCIKQSGGLLRCFFVMNIWTSSLALSAVHVTPVILLHLVFEADPVQLLSVSSKFQKSSLSAAVCQALCYDLGTHREMRESYLWRTKHFRMWRQMITGDTLSAAIGVHRKLSWCVIHLDWESKKASERSWLLGWALEFGL